MKKLSTAIRYECATSFKYIWIYYACVFGAIGLIWALLYAVTGDPETLGTNVLEFNTLIFAGILGGLGFREDFRMLIQNGFTRRYIFAAALAMFAFVSAIMALVDTTVGRVLHALPGDYDSMFGVLYGYAHHPILNWLWLFMVYMVVCCLLYFVVLVIHRIGKRASVLLGIGLGVVLFLLLPALLRFVVPHEVTQALITFAVRALGLAADGAMHVVYLTLLLLVGIFAGGAYLVIRRAEVR